MYGRSLSKSIQPRASEPFRRSTRVRTVSGTNSERSQSPTKKFKSAPSAFERLIAEEKRNRRKGIDGDAADRVLDAIRNSSPSKIDTVVPYPTPVSRREPPIEPEEEMELDVDLDKLGSALLDGMAIDGMLEDAKRSKREDTRSMSRRSAGISIWHGFWGGSESLKAR